MEITLGMGEGKTSGCKATRWNTMQTQPYSHDESKGENTQERQLRTG